MSPNFNYITEEFVCAAMAEYDCRGRTYMFKRYKSGPSTKWYLHHKGGIYDQKLIVQAAHTHAGQEGSLSFTSDDSLKYWKKYCKNHPEFTIVELCLELPDGRSILRR